MAETLDPTEQPDVQQEQAEHAGLHRAFLDDLIRQIRTGMMVITKLERKNSDL
jgi:hypothetical protein